MATERVLIVEDEAIVATDLESILKKLGYQVTGTVPTGEEAVQKAEETKPDLVLMDIRLKGAMDGIDAAEQITARFNIPVTYLTAYADAATLARAKSTMPYGYILKPFQENDIRAAAEVALYKHKMESMMSAIQNWHASTLQHMPDAVVATDPQDRITFLNEMAELFFGWTLREVYGKPFKEIFSLPVALEQMRNTVTPFRSETPTAMTLRNGRTLSVQYNVALIKEMSGPVTGLVVVFHPVVANEKNGRV